MTNPDPYEHLRHLDNVVGHTANHEVIEDPEGDLETLADDPLAGHWPERSRQEYISGVLTSIGQEIMAPVIDAPPDIYDDDLHAAYRSVSQWAKNSAAQLEAIIVKAASR